MGLPSVGLPLRQTCSQKLLSSQPRAQEGTSTKVRMAFRTLPTYRPPEIPGMVPIHPGRLSLQVVALRIDQVQQVRHHRERVQVKLAHLLIGRVNCVRWRLQITMREPLVAEYLKA